jgi:hypothetical protein
VNKSRKALVPGEEGFPNKAEHRTKPSDYNNRGFVNAPI